jgi:hypothetical protein
MPEVVQDLHESMVINLYDCSGSSVNMMGLQQDLLAQHQ